MFPKKRTKHEYTLKNCLSLYLSFSLHVSLLAHLSTCLCLYRSV